MNYLKQIRGFWRSHEEHLFTCTEVALYFHLVEVCNICGWKNPFKRNNSKIGADLGISINTLKNARNKLAQCGLISFKTQNGSPNVVYTLSKFDEVVVEVGSEVVVEVGSEVVVEVLPTKDKLNQTKLNKTKSHSETDVSVIEKIENLKNQKEDEKFNFKNAMLINGFDEKLVLEWLLIRKNKKAVNTETAFNNFISEVKKTARPQNDVLKIVVENSWKGFNAIWLENINQNYNNGNKNITKPIITNQTSFGKF